ncbi:phosphate ABC transporter permease subunit PstC [Calderihabitans maritimus]|uniref:Phosphate transport system permease protein n=1 Tax=Calderihabitans maritimus TaxID=1246530 RepID=A0A1Z5HVK6_9FIRM|nr:phosphate ABC transporter permease subunit PstC [Calderihabitans maritimus]GAW93566.1 phosphate ABC transporter permease [Calderihabitans maritimus]
MKRFQEEFARWFFLLNGITVIFILVGIFVLLLRNSIPAFREIEFLEFITGTEWNPTSYEKPAYGILAMMVSTLMVTGGSLLISVPFGIATAAYLAEVAGERTREILKPAIEILAGVPSVVIGFFGIVVLGPFLAKLTGTTNGLNALNGSILLGIMALPTVISLSEDAISAVPDEYRRASLAMGANRWQTLIHVVLPAASSGIVASVMLGMGRAIGETMTVLMATGNAPAMPGSFLDSVRTMTATIAIELGEVPYNTTHYYALFAVGLVLFLMTFVVNLAADVILHRHQEVTRR